MEVSQNDVRERRPRLPPPSSPPPPPPPHTDLLARGFNHCDCARALNRVSVQWSGANVVDLVKPWLREDGVYDDEVRYTRLMMQSLCHEISNRNGPSNIRRYQYERASLRIINPLPVALACNRDATRRIASTRRRHAFPLAAVNLLSPDEAFFQCLFCKV